MSTESKRERDQAVTQFQPRVRRTLSGKTVPAKPRVEPEAPQRVKVSELSRAQKRAAGWRGEISRNRRTREAAHHYAKSVLSGVLKGRQADLDILTRANSAAATGEVQS